MGPERTEGASCFWPDWGGVMDQLSEACPGHVGSQPGLIAGLGLFVGGGVPIPTPSVALSVLKFCYGWVLRCLVSREVAWGV
jgi:hypothetical protein